MPYSQKSSDLGGSSSVGRALSARNLWSIIDGRSSRMGMVAFLLDWGLVVWVKILCRNSRTHIQENNKRSLGHYDRWRNSGKPNFLDSVTSPKYIALKFKRLYVSQRLHAVLLTQEMHGLKTTPWTYRLDLLYHNEPISNHTGVPNTS